uniref:PEP-CTERM exosortase interaction domain-containing protein n=1 Tax=Nostoc sp. (strain PCC 9229) TaxID=70817 RepID=A0A2P0ZGM0_NOSS9|nr:hypothetical protein [Nostoc sp. PCC 9229]
MKAKNIGLLISGAVGGCLMSLAPATAAILVEPLVTTADPNLPEGVGIPLNLQPNELIFWNAPDTTGQQNFLNNTELTINSLSLLLFPDFDTLEDDVQWGDVNGDGQIGFSNIFPTLTVSPDFTVEGFRAPRFNFVGGEIPNNNRFVVQFLTDPDLRPAVPGDNGPLVVGGIYRGFQTVPEPSTIFGSVLALGLGGWLRKIKSAKV